MDVGGCWQMSVGRWGMSVDVSGCWRKSVEVGRCRWMSVDVGECWWMLVDVSECRCMMLVYIDGYFMSVLLTYIV